MEVTYSIIVMFVVLDISEGISHRGSPLNFPNYRGGLKILYKRKIRDTAHLFSENQTSAHPKTSLIALAPYHASKQHKMHISDFTNPKTGLNPFLDLLEGTSNNTSRNTSLTSSSKQTIIHVIPPPKTKANKLSEAKHNWNIKLASSKSQATFNKTPFIKNEWLTLEPVEGDSGGRIGRQQQPNRKTSSRGTSLFQDVTVHSPRGVQRNSKTAVWNDDTKRQHFIPKVDNQTTVTPKSSTTNSSNILTSTEGSDHAHNHITKAPKIIKPNNNRIKNNHEQIYSVNTNHKIIIISIVSGVTVVFLIILLTMCFCKERSKRFTGSRCIALENINANGSKKSTEHNYNLVREYRAVEDKILK